MTNLKTMILNRKDDLNDSEKKIIQYIFSNPEECSNLSLSELSRKLYVSQSAIFRLCKKLGLRGYSELKFDLDELVSQNKKTIKPQHNFAQDLVKANEDTTKYFASLNMRNLYQAIDKASMVYIYSTGWQQQLVAQYLSHEFFVAGVHTTILPAAVDELHQVTQHAKMGDILFVVSFTGDGEIVDSELTQLKLENDKLILVSFTNMERNKLASLSEYNMYFPVVPLVKNFPSKEKESIAFTSAYYLIDLLVSEYLSWQLEKED
ncbi:RpiR family glv operon transcriptional regulator [Lactobacillus colini]|uniref:RpiR family glv operon transcriptional regulator n=1 Tax=Lactobacillus colini TaxID=1819254 RepID=A0ABS4MDX2_9LACO|nr:MurR/RpiR family transcriptional regulator [Lactobacillus colini]MBP2057880.1 RpiR family glv operon transcriptional regulator [Lactobacillus colini]